MSDSRIFDFQKFCCLTGQQNAAALSAVHIPKQHGGQAADAVAGCIVIEEVARVCASSSMIPVANKLGTMGIVLRGSDELKAQVFPSLASGEALAAYALSEREAGSDAAAMKTRAHEAGDEWVFNGAKCWISNGGKASWYTRDGRDRSCEGCQWNLGIRDTSR